MRTRITAPWTSEQVQALNLYQDGEDGESYTCGFIGHYAGFAPILVATHSGWVCPDIDCSFTQNWAWAESIGAKPDPEVCETCMSGRHTQDDCPLTAFRVRTAKELGLAGNHWDAIQSHLDAYEDAVATRALHQVARLLEQGGYDDDSVNFVDSYADAWRLRPEDDE